MGIHCLVGTLPRFPRGKNGQVSEPRLAHFIAPASRHGPGREVCYRGHRTGVGGPPGFWFPYGAPGLPSLCRRGTVSVFFVNSQDEAPVSRKSNTGKY